MADLPATRRGRAARYLGSREALHRLFDEAPAPHFLFEHDMTVIAANRAGLKLFGYRRSEVLGCRVFDLEIITPALTRVIGHRLMKLLSGGTVPPVEMAVDTRDGRRVIVEARVHRLEVDGQTLIMASAVDVTERKRTEELLRAKRRRLHAAEKDLKALARRLISVREQERRNLAYLLHHEAGSLAVLLRRQIAGLTDVIVTGRLTETMEGLAESVALLDRHVAALKKCALDLRPPDLEGMGLAALVKSLYSGAAGQAGLRLSCRCRVNPRRIDTAASIVVYRVAQEALNNILAHARAASVDLELTARNGTVHLTVRDDGLGFAPARLPRNGRRSMGLQSMAEMAECLGGRVEIRSAPGRGTKIELTLPVHGELKRGGTGKDPGELPARPS